ncbi:piggyBac transposable element-derived protein 4-like [Phymastichus coffea]|uniref:piggyBac transposable element-derived protein 4-like n=1 Tax=Phymastichus coffea TaxID=108790 RepID=UPI00273B050C|nr:piggyBac transposable element-derived protein 4-like [Phymastichus coffea]
MEITFSYLGLVRNHEPDCIFGISSNLTVVAERLLNVKFLIPKNMERNAELSSSEDEFDFTMLKEEITGLHRELQGTENNSSSEDSDEVRGVIRRKIRVIDSECDSDTYTTEDSQSDSSEWITCTESEETPARIPFIAGDTTAGPHAPSDKEEPLDFLKLFVTNELVNEIVIETNNYAAKKLDGKTLSPYSIWRNWRNVTIEEMWAFIGVIINMGTMPLANLQEYWSRSDVSYIPFYSNKFTRDRFNQIFWMLHLKTIQRQDAGPRTRLQLVSCFLDYINSKFLNYFTPGREICVDESTIKFKGRVSFITYNPKKPTKWGIRVYTMADSTTGYICGILPYYGSLTTDSLIRHDLPVSTRIPLHLYSMLLEKLPGAQGHHMFTDRYYTSYILAEELLKLKCHLTGTILTNRKHLPEQIKRIKFGKKSIVAYRKKNTLILAWKDKRVVTCLTNWNNAGMTRVKRILRGGVEVTVKKPNVIIDYTKHMGGVDRADQYASTYCFLRKSLKWWRKLFFWGLEICLINSYILYKTTKEQRSERPLNHLQYLKTLVKQLTGDFHQPRDRASTSTAESDNIRLNGKLHSILTGVRKDCKVCSRRSKPGKRHQTTYYCDTCPDKPGMHLGSCYLKYHTMQNYKE